MKEKDLQMLRKLSQSLDSVKAQVDAELRRELWQEEIKAHQIATTHLPEAIQTLVGQACSVKDVSISKLDYQGGRWGAQGTYTLTLARRDVADESSAIVVHEFNAVVDVNLETITNVTVIP